VLSKLLGTLRYDGANDEHNVKTQEARKWKDIEEGKKNLE
jgi:hypothetical protein